MSRNEGSERRGSEPPWLVHADVTSVHSKTLLEQATGYVLVRLFPVGMLWMATIFGINLMALASDFIHRGTTELMNVVELVDLRTLVFVIVGFAVLAVVFAVVLSFMPFSESQHEPVRRFFSRIWDEISSAATHLSCSIMAVKLWGGAPSSGWLVCALSFALGLVAYVAAYSVTLKTSRTDLTSQ